MRIAPGALILPGPLEIAAVHAATISKHGALQVTPDLRRIETALAEVLTFHAFWPEADIALLAAVVAYAFAKGHPLPDGNKRVAFLSVRMVLRANGFTWKPRHEDAEQRMWWLAESTSEGLIRFLKNSRSGFGRTALRCLADLAGFALADRRAPSPLRPCRRLSEVVATHPSRALLSRSIQSPPGV